MQPLWRPFITPGRRCCSSHLLRMIFGNIRPRKTRQKISFLSIYGAIWLARNELHAREGVHHRTDGTRSRFVIVQRADKLAGKQLPRNELCASLSLLTAPAQLFYLPANPNLWIPMCSSRAPRGTRGYFKRESRKSSELDAPIERGQFINIKKATQFESSLEKIPIWISLDLPPDIISGYKYDID